VGDASCYTISSASDEKVKSETRVWAEKRSGSRGRDLRKRLGAKQRPDEKTTDVREGCLGGEGRIAEGEHRAAIRSTGEDRDEARRSFT